MDGWRAMDRSMIGRILNIASYKQAYRKDVSHWKLKTVSLRRAPQEPVSKGAVILHDKEISPWVFLLWLIYSGAAMDPIRQGTPTIWRNGLSNIEWEKAANTPVSGSL